MSICKTLTFSKRATNLCFMIILNLRIKNTMPKQKTQLLGKFKLNDFSQNYPNIPYKKKVIPKPQPKGC